MKSQITLTIVFYFILTSLTAQNYTISITGLINNVPTTLDSIVLENLTNKSRLKLDNHDGRIVHKIELTSSTNTLVFDPRTDEGFTILSNMPGWLSIQNKSNQQERVRIHVYNITGQLEYSSPYVYTGLGVPIDIYLNKPGIHLIVAESNRNRTIFKGIGIDGNRDIHIKSKSGFALPYLKSSTFTISEEFRFNPGDSIQISVFKKTFFAQPQIMQISRDEQIAFNLTHISAVSIKFADDNLLKALLESGVDRNNDQSISILEAESLYDFLVLEDKNIYELSGMEYFTNLNTLYLSYNNIEDLSPLLKLPKLKILIISNNLIKTSVFTEECPIAWAQIYKLHANGVNTNKTEYEQRIQWDGNKRSNNNPVWKVLFVIIKSIAMTTESGDSIISNLGSTEINITTEYTRLFKESLEKIMDYKINIEIETLITDYTVTGVMDYGINYDGSHQYHLFADDIPEIRNRLVDFDCAITILDIDKKFNKVGGLGHFDGNINIGMATFYLNSVFNGYKVNHLPLELLLQRLKINTHDAGTGVLQHEFIHTLEYYGLFLKYSIWEYHEALIYFRNNGLDEDHFFHTNKHYLSGVRNPYKTSETGIIDEIWLNPPTGNK